MELTTPSPAGWTWGNPMMAGERPGVDMWNGPPAGSRRFVIMESGVDRY